MYNRKLSISMTFLLKSNRTCHIPHLLHLLIIAEQIGNIFHFVLLQSESNIFLIAQIAVEELSCM